MPVMDDFQEQIDCALSSLSSVERTLRLALSRTVYAMAALHGIHVEEEKRPAKSKKPGSRRKSRTSR